MAGSREQQLADLLRAGLDDSLHRYETALAAQHSPLLNTPQSRGQALAHARQIVENTAQQIEGSSEGPPIFDLARDIGHDRAAAGVHPGESLRASNLLFDAIIRTSTAGLDGDQVTLACVTLQQVLTGVLRAAADSYAGVLLSRIHQAHVEERRRISRELHDRIAHGIILAQRDVESYELHRDSDVTLARARLDRARRGLADAVDVVRQVISDLRLVEPLESLDKALRLALEAFGAADLVSRVEVNGDEAWASPAVVEEVFLILREALRNTIAHAGAHHLLVRIDIAPDELRARVTDDGRGFDPAVGRPGGAGLLSMRERAALLGGALILTSHLNQGTHVELTVPLTRGA